MKTIFFVFVVMMSSFLPFYHRAFTEVQSTLELGQGVRHDHLRWSIGSRHHTPNILSELDYRNLRIYLSTLKATISNGNTIGTLDLAYGTIYRGQGQDSDYNKNNRHAESDRSYSKVPGDYVVDASVKLGRIVPLFSGITLTPAIGYGAFWQHLREKSGYTVIAQGRHVSKQTQSLRNLKDTYKAFWSAPFMELRCLLPLVSRLTADVGYAFFYPVHYIGRGHWKLRHMHFTQKNKPSISYGQKVDVGLTWAWTKRVLIGCRFGLAHFIAKEGHEDWRSPRSSGHPDFRRADRSYADCSLTLSYIF